MQVIFFCCVLMEIIKLVFLSHLFSTEAERKHEKFLGIHGFIAIWLYLYLNKF